MAFHRVCGGSFIEPGFKKFSILWSQWCFPFCLKVLNLPFHTEVFSLPRTVLCVQCDGRLFHTKQTNRTNSSSWTRLSPTVLRLTFTHTDLTALAPPPSLASLRDREQCLHGPICRQRLCRSLSSQLAKLILSSVNLVIFVLHFFCQTETLTVSFWTLTGTPLTSHQGVTKTVGFWQISFSGQGVPIHLATFKAHFWYMRAILCLQSDHKLYPGWEFVVHQYGYVWFKKMMSKLF